ncbi:MAG: hypothetical protein ACXABI_06320 [Candidatus Hodarchaeales archaeon]
MALYLYRNLWAPKQLRTLLLGVLMLSIGFLLELIFLFFLDDIKNSFLGVLYTEISFMGTQTPLLILFHLLVWGMIFFSTLMVYSVIREYSGGRTGMSEIIGIIAVIAITTWLLFDTWFSVFFILLATGIILYIYLSSDN